MLMAHACMVPSQIALLTRSDPEPRAPASHWRLPDICLHMLLQVITVYVLDRRNCCEPGIERCHNNRWKGSTEVSESVPEIVIRS
jgi:hypothetical protein